MTPAASPRLRIAPVRVAFLMDGSETYGVLQMTRLMLETVDRRHFQIAGVFLGAGPARDSLAPLCDEVVDLGIGCLLPLSRPGYSKYNVPNMARKSLLFVRAVLAVVRALEHLRSDLVHVHMYPIHLIAGLACRLRPTPCLWHWHSLFDPRRKSHRIACLAFGPLATRIACISRFVADGLPASAQRKVCVVYNAVKSRELRATQRPGALRARLGIPRAGPLVATFGSLAEYKGHEYFIQAAAAVLQELPDTYFAIVGGETEIVRRRFAREARLRQLVQDLGVEHRVLLAGHWDDAARYVGDCDLVCLPTIPLGIGGEGFGLVVAEAMAVGVPVIATSCGAPREIIEDRISGLLVPPRDSPALARAILCLLRNEAQRRAMGAAAQRRIADRFDGARLARDIEALYRACLAAGREHPAPQRVNAP